MLAEELLKLDETWVQGRIAAMSAFDIRLITASITLLAIDLVPHKANELKFNFARVSAQSFAVRGKTVKNIYKDQQELKEKPEQVEENTELREEAKDAGAGEVVEQPEVSNEPNQPKPFQSDWVWRKMMNVPDTPIFPTFLSERFG